MEERYLLMLFLLAIFIGVVGITHFSRNQGTRWFLGLNIRRTTTKNTGTRKTDSTVAETMHPPRRCRCRAGWPTRRSAQRQRQHARNERQ